MILLLLLACAFAFIAVAAAAATFLVAMLVFLFLLTLLSWASSRLRPPRIPRHLTIDALALSAPSPAPSSWSGRLLAPDLRDRLGRSPLARMVSDFMEGARSR